MILLTPLAVEKTPLSMMVEISVIVVPVVIVVL